MMAKVIKDTEGEILKIDCPVNLRENKNWMTARLEYYNFLDFDYPQIRALEDTIAQAYHQYMTALGMSVTKIYCHAWVNIIRKGEQITSHNHADAHTKIPASYSYLSGNLCIQAENTKTCYESPYNNDKYHLMNREGEMTLFPSFIYHHTTINESDEPRYSIAFDIITEEMYNLTEYKSIFKEISWKP
jgi:hypothetical protein